MTEHHVQIHGSGIGNALLIDGRDLSDSVTRLELVIDPGGEGTVLRLDMAGVHVTGVDTSARVVIDDETAAALKALGWTAPDGES